MSTPSASPFTASADWRRLLSESIASAADLQQHLPIDPAAIDPVIGRYPMRINPYYLSLISRTDDPVGKQAIPDPAELEDALDKDDPLAEEFQSPVPGLTHRYPDRVLFPGIQSLFHVLPPLHAQTQGRPARCCDPGNH